jgi:carbamoyltransferase
MCVSEARDKGARLRRSAPDGWLPGVASARRERFGLWILGLNGPPIGWHDPSACLIDGDGHVWAMAEEERFTRVKHAPRCFPRNAARFCLDWAKIEPDDLDVIAIGWDLPKLYSQLGGRWRFTTPRELLSRWLGWSFAGRRGPELVCVPHHRAHAVSAFYASGLEAAAILVNDGTGEEESISIFEARFGAPVVRREVWPRSHSLGFMYDATCRALGLTFLEAGKTMGLAAYGKANSSTPWRLMEGDGTEFHPPFARGPEADYNDMIPAWEEHLRRLGPFPVTTPSATLDTDELAVQIAWSAQAEVERIVPDLARHARAVTGLDAVCLAGGVALNCSTNGLLEDPIYVPPVSADAGAALGAAWAVAPPPKPLAPLSPYLGLEVETPKSMPGRWTAASLEPGAVVERLLRDQIGAVAWGRAEVGPRALGHRSVIAMPGQVAMRDRLNTIKGRELWRPLAPIGTQEADHRFWEGPRELQRYMLGAASVTPLGEQRIAATVHVDGTARAQIAEGAGFICDVLTALGETGADPVLINTSFNTRGEPIVNTAEDALRSAEALGVDFLVVGDVLLDRR